MVVFVTGATGFVGSFVAEELLRRGHTVRCLTRATSSLQWLEGLPVERVTGSLADENSLIPALRGADAVVHIAGLTAARNREEFFQGNQIGTRNLLNAARKAAPHLQRFLHMSSLAACGPAYSAAAPVRENHECKPITGYGESKLAAEQEALAYANEMPVTIIRPPAVYGQRDTAILSFFQTVQAGLIALIGFDEKLVSLVHAEDLARGTVDAMESPSTLGKTYFVSSEEFYTWKHIGNVTREVLEKKFTISLRLPHTVVKTIAGISGFAGRFSAKPPVLDYEKGIDITQPYWICSVERAREDFGYRQQVSLKDGITKTIRWYQQRGWLK